MKANQLLFALLLLLSAAVFQLPAKQNETDRKQFEEVKAKAEAGGADSELELGLRYFSGKGVIKNKVEAVKWYRKAAEQNNDFALESVPEVAAKLKEPNTKDVKFDDVVEQAKEAAVLVLVY